jgi:hypothetical protein
MASGYEKSPDYSGPKPNIWLWVAGAVAIGIKVFAHRMF